VRYVGDQGVKVAADAGGQRLTGAILELVLVEPTLGISRFELVEHEIPLGIANPCRWA
jgi:hypothetical protein